MNYRIDISISDADFARMQQIATDAVTAVNAHVIEVKAEDRINGANMGEKTGWTYVKKAFNALTAERGLVHPKLVNYDSFARGIDAATKLLAIKAICKNWVGNTEGTFMLLGLDLMEQAKYVRAALEPLAKNHVEYRELYDDLNFLYENRAEKAALTIEQNKRIAELTKQVEDLQKKG
jgi:hypothetical protein